MGGVAACGEKGLGALFGEARVREKEIKEQLEANKEAQYAIRKKKIAMLAEQHKNDPVRLALLNKVAKDLRILEESEKK